MDSRITDLEIKLAHQENLISQLNEMMYRQNELISHLNKRISKLESQLQEISTAQIKPLSEESPPPHY